MTEELTAPDLALVPDAKMFDLKAALAGRTYPTKDVPVFLDETLAWALKQANDAADRDPMNAELEAKRTELAEQFKSQILTFHLKGVPRHVRVAIEAQVEERIPTKYTMVGIPISDPVQSEAITEGYWSVYIQNVTGPDGSSGTMSPEDVHEFRRLAPEASVDAVTAAIRSLQDDSEKGYELGVQELSFLSQPSQGA